VLVGSNIQLSCNSAHHVRLLLLLLLLYHIQAADELKTRLSQDTGEMPHGLTACTFHSLCSKILW
jgi:superfamily I DNA/RNA helicase